MLILVLVFVLVGLVLVLVLVSPVLVNVTAENKKLSYIPEIIERDVGSYTPSYV